tara:strand:+ start:467 stop:910 length:444 start_codon:yes stop_codon:yes gene_type:complete
MVIKKIKFSDIRTIISTNNIMDNIVKLYIATKKSQKKLIICHKEFRNKYFMLINKNNKKMNIKADNGIRELKLLLNYLKKHHELKVIHNAYKDIMSLYLNLKKKFVYFSHISKPLISDSQLKEMVKQQEDLMEYIDHLNSEIPKLNF